MNRDPLAKRLASWSCGLGLDAVPEPVRNVAKRCVTDLFAVSIAGAARPEARRILDYATQAYAPGPATVIGFRERLSPVGAALVNGTTGHLLDFDDTSYTGIMHGTTVVLPAALAAVEHSRAGGQCLLEAFIAGSEVSYAVALLCTESHYYKGWWSTATFGVYGAAAAAARAMGLSQVQTTFALALAGAQAGGLKVAFGTDAKPYLAGRAAAIGVEAAWLASHGHNGPASVLEADVGFIQVLNDGIFDNSGIDALGKDWRLSNPGIFFKSYPVCSAAHAAVELVQSLMQEKELECGNIRKVICEVPPLVAMSLVYDQPQTVQQAQFSMRFAVGTVLARGQLGITNITQEALSDPVTQMEMAKVEMHSVESLRSVGAPECARVTILTNDGRELTRYLGEPTGMPRNPMSDEAMAAKFRQCTASAGLSSEQSDVLLRRLETIGSASSEPLCLDFASAAVA